MTLAVDGPLYDLGVTLSPSWWPKSSDTTLGKCFPRGTSAGTARSSGRPPKRTNLKTVPIGIDPPHGLTNARRVIRLDV